MRINKVEINNFYSIKNATLSFDKFKGIVLVNGKNKDTGGSNGSGKSALIESVVWGLFGKTIRKSTEEALINVYTKKACSVRLTVNGNVVIERGKKPTYLRFFVGEDELTQDNALQTQKLIEEYLKTNYKVFLASTVFGQQNNIEFISATPEDKRTIIKNFLNMESIFELRESVKYLKSQYSQTIKNQTAVISEHEKSIKSFDKKLTNLEGLRKGVEGKYSEEALSLSLEEVIKLENENQNIDWEIAGCNKEIEALDDRLRHLQFRIENPKESEYCQTCGQPLDEPFHPARVREEMEQCKGYIEEQEVDIRKKQEEIKPLPITSSEYHQVIEYNALKKESETFEELREETKQKIQDAHDIKQEYNTKYEIMRFWEKAFSESGLVRYIIKNILSYFNGKTNFYLSHLSKGKFFIEFDEELKETILHNGQHISYISLSGGEKRKIGLAVMLGLQQLLTLSHKSDNNLMFFDEVAENLDQDGLDGLYILLSELKKTKNLFVITHNNYLKSLMDNVKTLTITKSKGTSSITGR
jgi:DNA repair exonuclease SbcCD ATPase subunit